VNHDIDDSHQSRLAQYADRAVDSLPASRRRRAAIREELAAHLAWAFAEERERASDESAALDATLRRFGDCDVLANELEASVPALERITFLLFGRERHMWRLLVLLGLLVTLVGTMMVLPELAMLKDFARRNGGDGERLMRLVVALILGVTLASAGVHLLGWGIVRRLRKTV
jgi:hypothetical protein